jgi:PAS domain S-box-containing protein
VSHNSKVPSVPKRYDPSLFELMAIQTLDYAIFLLDRDGNILSWNAGARRIKGYEESEIVGKHFSLFYTYEDIAREWPTHELKTALREGRFEDEGWRVKKDGSRFWANVVITALRDDGGKLLAYSKITRDLTERKRQEEDLRQSEERFRLLVEGVSDYAIYLLSPEGIVTSWNLGARRIKGYEASEIIGQHFSRFYDAEGIESGQPWAELAVAREHGRAEDEGWRIRKDGSRFWARVVVTALHNADGRLRGFAKVTQDLTQRRHAEALEEAAGKITNFIAVLAHELRNPLAPIRNAVQLLEHLSPGDRQYEGVRQIIDRQSSQLSRIVDDLLDVNRITRGTLQINFATIALGDVVARAIEAARPTIEQGEHTLELDLPATPVHVLGDELRLNQALLNILNNAARYSERRGRIIVKVSSTAGPGARVAAISVRDTGYGIDAEMIGSIFGMFIQGRDPMRRSGAGLGIGLALARSIVELHHGTLVAQSGGIGKGSEFTIQLPLVDAPTAAATAGKESAKPLSISASAPGEKCRILIVDDNVDAAVTLASLLKKHGNEVHCAYDGQEALSEFEAFGPDIVLLDIGMPGMDGLAIARRLRATKRAPRPLIIAITGWGKPEDEERSRDAGFDFHLVKPVEEQTIIGLIAGRSKRVH